MKCQQMVELCFHSKVIYNNCRTDVNAIFHYIHFIKCYHTTFIFYQNRQRISEFPCNNNSQLVHIYLSSNLNLIKFKSEFSAQKQKYLY